MTYPSQPRRRYVIVGAGAVGALLAAQLRQAGIDNVLVARGAQLDALRVGPLQVHRPHGIDQVRLDVVGGPAEVELRSGDVLIVATKSQDVETVLQDWSWQPVAGVAGVASSAASLLPVVLLQNGLAAEDAALRRFSRVISASIIVSASYLEAGHVTAPSWPLIGALQIGAYPSGPRSHPHDLEVRDLAGDLETAKYIVRVRADVERWKASKLLGNLGNAVEVLSGTADAKAELRAFLTEEGRRVYVAAGIDSADSIKESDVNLLEELKLGRPTPLGPLTFPSHQSFARGASSEIDFLNGEIVLLGRRYGVPTPYNLAVQQVLGLSSAVGEGPEARTVADVVELATRRERTSV